MKSVKIFISFLLFVIVFLVGSSVYAASYYVLNGDVNYSGAVDSTDARDILRSSIGLLTYTGQRKNLADMDFDRKITSTDARLALRASVGYNEAYKVFYHAFVVRDYVISKRYYQAAKTSYGNKCWGFAGIYAKAINTGNTAIIQNNINNGNNPSGVSMTQTTGSESTILKAIASQLRARKACVVQVNGSGDGRHYVVVAGHRANANLNALKASDLLLLDVYDGELKPVSGGSRHLFANRARYGYDYQMFTVD